MADTASVTVEFYGIPRQRAGRAELAVPAGTVKEMLQAIEQACPGLKGLTTDGLLSPHYLLSINGEQFVTDIQELLASGVRVVLLSADAGG